MYEPYQDDDSYRFLANLDLILDVVKAFAEDRIDSISSRKTFCIEVIYNNGEVEILEYRFRDIFIIQSCLEANLYLGVILKYKNSKYAKS